MATNFADLKKNKANKFESLVQQSEKLNEKVSYVDERIWKCERDKNGNGYAVIRFLPECKGETNDFVTMFRISEITLAKSCCISLISLFSDIL